MSDEPTGHDDLLLDLADRITENITTEQIATHSPECWRWHDDCARFAAAEVLRSVVADAKRDRMVGKRRMGEQPKAGEPTMDLTESRLVPHLPRPGGTDE